MHPYTHTGFRVLRLFVLAAVLMGAFSCHPGGATTILVIPPDTRGVTIDGLATRFASDVIKELNGHPGLNASLLDPQSKLIQDALHKRRLIQHEIQDPYGFGSSMKLARIGHYDLVVFGSISTEPGSGMDPMSPLQFSIFLGEVRASRILPITTPPGDVSGAVPNPEGSVRQFIQAMGDDLAAQFGTHPTTDVQRPSPAAAGAPVAAPGPQGASPAAVPTPMVVTGAPIVRLHPHVIIPSQDSPGAPPLEVSPRITPGTAPTAPASIGVTTPPASAGPPVVTVPAPVSIGVTTPPTTPGSSAVVVPAAGSGRVVVPAPASPRSLPVVQVEAEIKKAELMAGGGDRAGGEVVLRSALLLAPDDPRLQASLAGMLMADGQLSSAVALYQDAVTTSPFDPDIRLGLAAALEAQGDLRTATSTYQEALRLDPTRASICTRLGRLLLRRGLMSEALAMLNEGVRLGDVSASDSLADALISTGDLDKAEAVLRTAMERAPADPRCRRRLASLLSREGKAAAAIRILLEGVKRGEPVDGEAVPVAEAALDSETALLLREIQGAANGDLDTFKGRVLAVADLGDALPDNERATRTSRRRAAAASDLLQALTEKQHEASDPSVAGNVAVLIAQAQQLLSDDTPPTPTAQ